MKNNNNLNNTSVGVTGNGVTNATGSASTFNWGGLGDVISAGGQAISNIVSAVFAGKAVQSGNYYSQYNQGNNNAWNSTGTIVLIMASVTALVLLKKQYMDIVSLVKGVVELAGKSITSVLRQNKAAKKEAVTRIDVLKYIYNELK